MKHRLKYLLTTFLTSIALTFHFLQSRTLRGERQREKATDATDDVTDPGDVSSMLLKPGWTVLDGNVTVHVGVEASNSKKPAYTMNAESLCSTFDDERTKLLILVASKAENVDRRQALRDTWALRALQEALNFRVAFVVGQADGKEQDVKAESIRYGDVVQVDIPEYYRNLGRKSVAGLFWSAKYCNDADFVVKTDDDIFIHVPNLIDAIQSSEDREDLLLCRENRMHKIHRKELKDKVPENYIKYEVRDEELPGVYYPPYCSGMAYAISRAVRARLLQASLITPLFFIEDVYLTGFCRHKAGVRITSHPGITLRPPVTPAQAPCVFREGRITSQEVDVAEMRVLWSEINTKGFFCPQLVGYARLSART